MNWNILVIGGIEINRDCNSSGERLYKRLNYIFVLLELSMEFEDKIG